jgi:hypothetical protein
MLPYSFPKLDGNKRANIFLVRGQVFWVQSRLKLGECLAHLVGFIMRRAGGDASGVLRASFV